MGGDGVAQTEEEGQIERGRLTCCPHTVRVVPISLVSTTSLEEHSRGAFVNFKNIVNNHKQLEITQKLTILSNYTTQDTFMQLE